ncbi:glutaredoxin-C1-like [Salvia hispanica]|nr:glutaredoxin-C1-like [Salvia hispanica]
MEVVAKDVRSAAVRIVDQQRTDLESACEKVSAIVAGNAVVVFTISGCCMCHVVKQLLFGLGVGPTVVELDREAAGGPILSLLHRLGGGGKAVPAVFVGGKFLGGIETVMACHINGSLVPLLKNAGALWL